MENKLYNIPGNLVLPEKYKILVTQVEFPERFHPIFLVMSVDFLAMSVISVDGLL